MYGTRTASADQISGVTLGRQHQEIGTEGLYAYSPNTRRGEKIACGVYVCKVMATMVAIYTFFYFVHEAVERLKHDLNSMEESDTNEAYQKVHTAFLIEHKVDNFNLCEKNGPSVFDGYALINDNRSRYFYWFIPCRLAEAPLVSLCQVKLAQV
jgi:hypothetical protein